MCVEVKDHKQKEPNQAIASNLQVIAEKFWANKSKSKLSSKNLKSEERELFVKEPKAAEKLFRTQR